MRQCCVAQSRSIDLSASVSTVSLITGVQAVRGQTAGATATGFNHQASLKHIHDSRSRRSPNSSGSSASSTKRLRASPPPKPTPKRTSKTPAPSLKATSNPSSPSAARGGWRRRLATYATSSDGIARTTSDKVHDERSGIPFVTASNVSDVASTCRIRMDYDHSRGASTDVAAGNSEAGDVLFMTAGTARQVACSSTARDELPLRQRIVHHSPNACCVRRQFLYYFLIRSPCQSSIRRQCQWAPRCSNSSASKHQRA